MSNTPIYLPAQLRFTVDGFVVEGELLFYTSTVGNRVSYCRVDRAYSDTNKDVPNRISDCFGKIFSSVTAFTSKATASQSSSSGWFVAEIYFDNKWNKMSTKNHKDNIEMFNLRVRNTKLLEDVRNHADTSTSSNKRKESPNATSSPNKRQCGPSRDNAPSRAEGSVSSEQLIRDAFSTYVQNQENRMNQTVAAIKEAHAREISIIQQQSQEWKQKYESLLQDFEKLKSEGPEWVKQFINELVSAGSVEYVNS
jgi:hypothetical protein